MPLNFVERFSLAARILLTGRLPGSGTGNGSLGSPQKRASIPAITAEEVAEARQFFPADKFFIYGHARSGTTLLARLVRLHPQVHCNYQAHFFTRTPLLQALVMDKDVETWLARRSNRWNRGRDLSPLVLRAAADFIMEREARSLGKTIVGDKSPNSLLDGQAVRLLYDVYPDGRLIYIMRDGRDTALSHRFQAFIDNPQSLSREDLGIREAFSQDPQPFLGGQRSVFTEKGIRQAAEGWVKNVTETDGEGRRLFGKHYYALRYEDLLLRPADEMRRLWAFLGADAWSAGAPGEAGSLPVPEAVIAAEMNQNPDADWQQEKAGEIAQALQKGKEGSWREMFTARDREIFQQVAGSLLAQWDYKE